MRLDGLTDQPGGIDEAAAPDLHPVERDRQQRRSLATGRLEDREPPVGSAVGTRFEHQPGLVERDAQDLDPALQQCLP
mgnify:CR=1 FL=1